MTFSKFALKRKIEYDINDKPFEVFNLTEKKLKNYKTRLTTTSLNDLLGCYGFIELLNNRIELGDKIKLINIEDNQRNTIYNAVKEYGISLQ